MRHFYCELLKITHVLSHPLTSLFTPRCIIWCLPWFPESYWRQVTKWNTQLSCKVTAFAGYEYSWKHFQDDISTQLNKIYNKDRVVFQIFWCGNVTFNIVKVFQTSREHSWIMPHSYFTRTDGWCYVRGRIQSREESSAHPLLGTAGPCKSSCSQLTVIDGLTTTWDCVWHLHWRLQNIKWDVKTLLISLDCLILMKYSFSELWCVIEQPRLMELCRMKKKKRAEKLLNSRQKLGAAQ